MSSKNIFVLRSKVNGLWSLTAWVQILGVALTICVTLSKLLNCSEPQFPYLENQNINVPFS